MNPTQLHALAKSCPYDFMGMVNAMQDDNDGFLATGGDLEPATLVGAYLAGAFPWYDDEPICWWSPSPRCVIFPQEFTPKKSLVRTAKKQPWTLTVNHAFDDVIHACTQARTYSDGTWINDDIVKAYQTLHKLGVAKSVEIWAGVPHQSELIGGLYGLQLGKVFCGESMFHRQTDASKIAFWGLMALCHVAGVEMVDCQLENGHLMSLGACLVPREQFLKMLYDNSCQNAMPLTTKAFNDKNQMAIKELADTLSLNHRS